MPLVTSGQISLNDMHVEVGGISATQCSLDDADIRGLIGKSSGAQSQFNEFYGASSVQYIVFAPVSGTYSTFDSGDYRYYQFSGARNTAPSITNLGTAGNDRERLYFKIWGAGGGGGGGGTYAGADGGAGGHVRGYYIPTATGKLRIQVGSGGQGGENMNSGFPTIDGGAGGQPSSISNTNLLGGAGGAGYGAIATYEVGGGGGGGGATRFRTEWSTNGPASPTFEVWVGGGGGGGGSDQSASGVPTAGGSGGSVNLGAGSNYTSGLTASTINKSGGGGGATSSAGGAGGVHSGNGASGQAGVVYHGGDGASGPSSSFGGGGGGGAGLYGGGGGATGSASQAAGGGGGSGNHSGSVAVTAANRQSLGTRNATNQSQLGYVSPAGFGGLKGPQTLSAGAVTRAGSAGSGCVVLYHKFRN